MAGGSNTNNGKVKVRKVSLSVNSPARRKVSKTNKNSGLNALPPFQWSSVNDQQTTLKNKDTMDQVLMPPPIITRGLKSSGIRKLVAQYAQVSSYSFLYYCSIFIYNLSRRVVTLSKTNWYNKLNWNWIDINNLLDHEIMKHRVFIS